jgi:folate-dependent phosphoribosylglycinamide formyltransferase PurN
MDPGEHTPAAPGGASAERAGAPAQYDQASEVGALDVVVLTSTRTGMAAAAALQNVPAIRRLTLLTAPLPVRPRSIAKLRRMYREVGVLGVLRSTLALLRSTLAIPLRRDRDPSEEVRRLASMHAPAVEHMHITGFHSPECIRLLRELKPDIGVIVATHMLRREVFSQPRLGCINLHLGKAPEFRGSSPGFWEMYHGVAQVGVTVHWVTDTLDGGDVLLQEVFPLDLAPPGDPVRYLNDYQWRVLMPNGCRMLGAALTRIAAGECEGEPQDPRRARTFQAATQAARRELRRRVARRRRTDLP